MPGAPPWSAVRLVHPYPSALNAAVTVVVALLAGGTAERAALLGTSMLLLQFAIGATNDWSDAASDALVRPGKPIPAGLVRRDAALAVAVGSAAVGLALPGAVGPAVLALAGAGLAAGLAYDLALKGTPWSWLPFAAGFALLPLFAWVGSTNEAPPFGAWVVALALPAGAAVSLANGLVDLEADRLVGRRGPAVLLGRSGTLSALLTLHALVAGGAAVTLLAEGVIALLPWAGVAAGAILQGAGLLVARDARREGRAQGWGLQALGLAVLAGGWFAGMAL